MKKPFRVHDRVSVHNLGLARAMAHSGTLTEGDTVIVKGRVICTTRRSRHGLCVVVLCDLPHGEIIETFAVDGKRSLSRDGCFISQGWPRVD